MTERDFRVKKGLKVEGGDVVVSSSYKVDTPTLDVTTINLGNADTTLVRSGAGDASIEGNVIYRAGGTTVPISDGGTGATSASAARTALGLAIGTHVQAYDAQLADIAGLATTNGGVIVGDGSNFVLETGGTLRSSLGLGTGDSPQFNAINVGHASDTTITKASAGDINVEGNIVYRAGGTNVAIADGGTNADNISDARTNLGLEIGTDVQAYDAGLAAIAGLATTDGGVIVGNGSTYVLETGDTLRTSLGLAIGTNVQAYDAQLADIAGLSTTNGGIIVGDGSNFVLETGATLRTSIGVGTGDSPTFTNLTLSGDIELGHASDTTISRDSAGVVSIEGAVVRTGTVAVADGGTGATTDSGARTNLGLGDAATKTVGVGNGNVLTAVSAGLSNNEFLKVDGSAIEGRNTLEMRSDLGIGDVGLVDTITTSHITPSVLVTASEGIGSNSADDKIPTTAAVKAYADSVSGGTVSGSDGQIQYNNSGAFGGDADFTWDDTNNRLVIGSATSYHDSLYKLTVKGSDAGLLIEKSDDGTNAGPSIALYRHQSNASLDDGDLMGQITFRGEDSAGNPVTYSSIRSQIVDEASSSKDGRIILRGLVDNTQTNLLSIDGSTAAFSADVTVAGNATITGNLTVDGTTTTVNSTTLAVDDKNIELAHSPSGSEGNDSAVDGGGITLKSSDSDKTFNWNQTTGGVTSNSWTSSEHMDLASGKTYKINNTQVLSATTLGSGVTASSLTSVGTLTTLTVDNVLINGTQIGHTSDIDLITLASDLVTVAGEVSMTTLDIGGTNVTSTATELNLLDGSTAGSVVNSKAAIYSSAGRLAATTVDVNSAVVTDAFKEDSNQNWAASAQDLDSFSATAYRGAKVLIQMHDDSNGHYEIVEMNVTHNGSTAYYSVYGQVSTHTADLGTYSATLASNTIKIQFTPATGSLNWKYSIKMEYFDVQ